MKGSNGLDGELVILYTTETGGIFKAAHATLQQYEDAVASGELEFPSFTSPKAERVPVKMIALCRVEKNHDFILGGSRDHPETWTHALS